MQNDIRTTDWMPYSIYEVHLGSWRRTLEDNRALSYRELAEVLPQYVKDMGFTPRRVPTSHGASILWLLGISDGRLFCPTSRYGDSQDFMYLIDQLHRGGIGVILDWVPSISRAMGWIGLLRWNLPV